MLTGTSFIGGEDLESTCKLILGLTDKSIKEKLDFWQGKLKLSSEVLELLAQMLRKDPEKRITIEEVMKHRWVEQNGWLSESEMSS